MNNPNKTSAREVELKEFKLPQNSGSDEIRIPLLPSSEKPIYKPVI